MDEYQGFLAQSILVNGTSVTYRLLSRRLGVHVNMAKEMMFDWYRSQNPEGQGEVDATYLVTGVSKQSEADDYVAEAVSLGEDAPVLTVRLVLEAELQEALAQYSEVISVHIYCLSPKRCQAINQDTKFLCDIWQNSINCGDPAVPPQPYGAVAASKLALPHAPVSHGSSPEAHPLCHSFLEKPLLDASHELKDSGCSGSIAASNTSRHVEMSASGKKSRPTGPADPVSGIAVPFAKVAARREGLQSSTRAQKQQSAQMKTLTAHVDHIHDYEGLTTQDHPPGRQNEVSVKNEHDGNLPHVLAPEEDDEGAAYRQTSGYRDGTGLSESPLEESIGVELPCRSPSETTASGKVAIMLESEKSDHGQSRGRRRVKKKKQVMDEQGYLVTIQEQGWESFSEDETAPVSGSIPPSRSLATPTSSINASQSTKPKKLPPKGQGSIVSFFVKK